MAPERAERDVEEPTGSLRHQKRADSTGESRKQKAESVGESRKPRVQAGFARLLFSAFCFLLSDFCPPEQGAGVATDPVVPAKRRFLAAILIAGSVVIATIVVTGTSARTRPVSTNALTIDRANREVRIRAIVQPGAMHRPLGVKGHHAIVWKRGRAATWALFRSEASDRDVRAALDSLGAVAGENLSIASWTERDDPRNSEADKKVEGSPIDVHVTWSGLPAPLPLSSLLTERGSDRPQLDFRYGGNERFQTEFKSGCIVCLYSCPGGAIGNRSHPIRDYVRDGVVYSAIKERLPGAGSPVILILKPRLEER